MVVSDIIITEDGVELKRTRSNLGFQIEDASGVRYDIALDPIVSDKIYIETNIPVESGIMKYSVVSIIEAMRVLGKYEEFRAMLEAARLDWDFVGANYMAENHPSFVRMCGALVESGIVTKAQLDEMLPKCVWKAE